MAEPKAEPKKKYVKGTPEGDKLVRVRWMRRGSWGPTPKLEKTYEVGEECVIPMWRFTDWHNPETIVTARGESMSFRGSHEMADRPKPVDDNVGKHSEDMQEVLAQNEELRKRLAILEGRNNDEVFVIPESPEAPAAGKRGKKQEI